MAASPGGRQRPLQAGRPRPPRRGDAPRGLRVRLLIAGRLAAASALCLIAAGAPAQAPPPGEEAAITFAGGEAHPEIAGIRKALDVYVLAVTRKDVELFRTVKPGLSADEEKRARAAFKSVGSQVVRMNVLSADIRGASAVLKIARRDTLNGSIVSSFPQTFTMAKGTGGWVIVDIGR